MFLHILTRYSLSLNDLEYLKSPILDVVGVTPSFKYRLPKSAFKKLLFPLKEGLELMMYYREDVPVEFTHYNEKKEVF